MADPAPAHGTGTIPHRAHGPAGAWLPPGEVHARHWRLDAEDVARALPAEAALSTQERARADRFRSPEDRRRYVRSHLGLRALLAPLVAVAPAELMFDTTCRHCGDAAHGKPRVVAPVPSAAAPPPGGLDFSLSHAGEVALLAVAAKRAVGADVEAMRPGLDWREVAATALSGAERAEVEASPRDQQPMTFLRLWTRKEALLKTWGHGVVADLRSADVAHPATGGAGVIRVIERAGPEGRPWSFQEVDVGGNHVATVGAEGRDWVLRVAPWSPVEG